ncbi:unnamed protein product, partial [Meganyctiphanes norvegica]
MTVTYSGEVASIGGFKKLLFKWRGSVYKLVWKDLLFRKIAMYSDHQSTLIPLSFAIGFYVTLIVQRWWDQYRTIPWPDNMAILTSALIPGKDDLSLMYRRCMLRYAILAMVLTMRMICVPVKKRFPTIDHLVQAGLLLPHELQAYNDMEAKCPYSIYWLPLLWAKGLALDAHDKGFISNDHNLKLLLEELTPYRKKCGRLLSYSNICIPLVYTQVVTLAVYLHSMSSLLGAQAPGEEHHDMDTYFPFFTVIQFIFYMGWLRVAESLINPFGEDDDDFEINKMIDRNVQIAWIMVDHEHCKTPEVAKDIYWDERIPVRLLYNTAGSKKVESIPEKGTTNGVSVSVEDAIFKPNLDNISHTPQLSKISSQKRLMVRIRKSSQPNPVHHNPAARTYSVCQSSPARAD